MPSVIYCSVVFDSLRELSEESMAPTEIYDINKTYDCYKSVRGIEPPASIVRIRGLLVLNLLLLGPPVSNFETLGKEIALRPTIDSQTIQEDYGESSRGAEYLDWKLLLMNLQLLMPPLTTQISNTSTSWANTGRPFPPPQGNAIGVAPEVPVFVTIKDGRFGKLKRNLVFQDEVANDAEGSDEIDGEEVEITIPIQRRRIQSISLSSVPASTTIHEVIRSPQPPQPPIRSPSRPSTLASTSTNIKPPMASTCRDPISPEPESIIDHL
ncbi:hypothetical protein O181_016539 [Austropuccinia psidii MF-1]|uniref:Uncharacterized protein n=1 Tax=Austropuccinia psidii MF-1 TaxID=1389203 RepID=A0A9Q3C434_9BASI|nr:hypothetical protein [Austropuccinia psidii MF-1]